MKAFEDLPLYKEYLSGFDVEHDLEGFELCYNPDMEEYKSDFPMLLRLVAASFSSTYSFEYDISTNEVELVVSAAYRERSKIKRCGDVSTFNFRNIFKTYLEEQLNYDANRGLSEPDREWIDEKREQTLKAYHRNIMRLKLPSAFESVK